MSNPFSLETHPVRQTGKDGTIARSKGTALRSTEAYDVLRRELETARLAPGMKLTIAELKQRYGIGSMPLREALNRLAAEHFVLKHEGRGFSVPPLDPGVFLDIQNARVVVETAALADTIENRSKEWEDRMVLAFHHLNKATRIRDDFLLTEAWSVAHAEFHRELIAGCRNEWLLTFASQLFVQSARYRNRRRQIDAGRFPRSATLIDEHREIMEAAFAGDTALAEAKLIEHYRRSVETVLGETVVLCGTQRRFCRASDV
jgi:GntR family transcriptional regulator, carbon starvation induced regulator